MELYPSFSAEIEEIRKNRISKDLLYKIIQKHLPNSNYNKGLYKRYMGIQGGVPIYDRQPRYEEESNPINNKLSTDFFGEIIDFKVGYIAGKPFSYSYSDTDESEEETGGDMAVEEASKTISDFVTRNNMFGVDMEITKNAGIYGYSGRLFYIDKDGNERVIPIHGYETIVLSETSMSEPEYAIRYYKNKDISGAEYWTVEFYDDKYKYTYKGDLMSLEFVDSKAHLFDYCPLQGVMNNNECLGDAEKVLSLIDDYDKVMSDNSNEIEAFTHALMQIGVNIPDEVIEKSQKTGVIVIPQVGANPVSEPVKWVTKNVNDTFTRHHLESLEDNIYSTSKTPNLRDESFGSASGISLKLKLNGLETKCAISQAKIIDSAQYMWKVLCSSWQKKDIKVDPLQIVVEPRINFPQDELSTAQTVQAEIAAGAPKVFAFRHFTDDPEWLIELQKKEMEDVEELYTNNNVIDTDNTDVDNDDKATNTDLNKVDTGAEKIELLNGAQITALTGIIKNVNDGVLSRKAAITMAVSTLGISRENAEAIIEEKIK